MSRMAVRIESRRFVTFTVAHASQAVTAVSLSEKFLVILFPGNAASVAIDAACPAVAWWLF